MEIAFSKSLMWMVAASRGILLECLIRVFVTLHSSRWMQIHSSIGLCFQVQGVHPLHRGRGSLCGISTLSVGRRAEKMKQKKETGIVSKREKETRL